MLSAVRVRGVGVCRNDRRDSAISTSNAVCDKSACSNVLILEELGKLVNVWKKEARLGFASAREGQIVVCTHCEETLKAAGRAAQLRFVETREATRK